MKQRSNWKIASVIVALVIVLSVGLSACTTAPTQQPTPSSGGSSAATPSSGSSKAKTAPSVVAPPVTKPPTAPTKPAITKTISVTKKPVGDTVYSGAKDILVLRVQLTNVGNSKPLTITATDITVSWLNADGSSVGSAGTVTNTILSDGVTLQSTYTTAALSNLGTYTYGAKISATGATDVTIDQTTVTVIKRPVVVSTPSTSSTSTPSTSGGTPAASAPSTSSGGRNSQGDNSGGAPSSGGGGSNPAVPTQQTVNTNVTFSWTNPDGSKMSASAPIYLKYINGQLQGSGYNSPQVDACMPAGADSNAFNAAFMAAYNAYIANNQHI